MVCHIEIAQRAALEDPAGQAVLEQAKAIGVQGLRAVRTAQVYVLQGLKTEAEAQVVARDLLLDPLVQECTVGQPLLREGPGRHVVQILRKPGVMDPVEASVLKGIEDLGLRAERVRTVRKYLFDGDVDEASLRTVATRLLANEVIEEILIGDRLAPMFSEGHSIPFRIRQVALRNADDEALLRTSREGCLSLNLEEMRTVQKHYRDLGREPTDVELETLAQTWSEHCVHKTLKGDILFRGQLIRNLLKSTIFQATKELNRPWCVSVFEDNAGVIEFDENYHVCFKVETHNHPSAIEPYGGSSTGIGGVIRDCLGTGLGARPILNTDVFCFAPPDMAQEAVPKGVIHPKRLMKQVVAGVRDYGNRMGIPTANGAIFFDPRYLGNPLVYCGNLGLIPRNACHKEARPGDRIIAVGGRTGRDGIHGATFSSIELTDESEVTSSGAVQIGNPIMEKKMTDILLQARDRGLYRCITDCGAGGFSSAVGEMGKDIGAEVELSRAPLKYEGLTYTEIWISEAQERMVVAVPPEKEAEFHDLMRSEDVESTTLGHFTDTGELRLLYRGQLVGQINMKFLHDGIPRLQRKAEWNPPSVVEPELPIKRDYGEDLKRILGAWNVCSKEWVIRQYDHEVQGASVLKPLVGAENDGPGDATVIAPVLGSCRGVAVANGMNPKYGDVDPYAMAASAIEEAIRQIIAVGGTLDRIALLDNFCWGNTDKPDRLGSLVLAAQACHDLSLGFGTPFISGKDSLNNEFQAGNETIVIPPSLLISAIGLLADIRKVVSMDAKAPGNRVYLAGLTKRELGGSHYYALNGYVGRQAPQVDIPRAKALMTAVSRAMDRGLVRACHDCSEGGLAVAAAEMAFAGGFGIRLQLGSVPADPSLRPDELLFSESNSRFLMEVEPQRAAEFEAGFQNLSCARIGEVTPEPLFSVFDAGEKEIIHERLADLKEAWQRPLRW